MITILHADSNIIGPIYLPFPWVDVQSYCNNLIIIWLITITHAYRYGIDNKQIKLHNEVLIKRYKVCEARMMRHGAAWWCRHYNERTASSFMRGQYTRNNGAYAEWYTNMIDTAYVQEDVRKRLRTHSLWCRASDRKHGMRYWFNEGCCRSFEVELQPICERARTGICHHKVIIMISCLSDNRMSGGH